jgi:hypothetical protein
MKEHHDGRAGSSDLSKQQVSWKSNGEGQEDKVVQETFFILLCLKE